MRMTSAPWSAAQTTPSMMSLSWPRPSAPSTVTGMTLTPAKPTPAMPLAVVGLGGDDAGHRGAVAVRVGRAGSSRRGSTCRARAAVEVRMRGVDAGVEDGDDRRAGRRDGAVDVVPADLGQRPLVAVGRVVRGGASASRTRSALDAGDALVRAQLVDGGLETGAAGKEDAVDAERDDVVVVLCAGRREDLSLSRGRRSRREADEIGLCR